jgi:hypothetical protein
MSGRLCVTVSVCTNHFSTSTYVGDHVGVVEDGDVRLIVEEDTRSRDTLVEIGGLAVLR